MTLGRVTAVDIAHSGADRHDSMLVEPIRDSLRLGQGCGPRLSPTAPGHIYGNKGYDDCRVPDLAARRRITARIARLGIDSSQRLGGSGGSLSALWAGCRANALPCAVTGPPPSSPFRPLRNRLPAVG